MPQRSLVAVARRVGHDAHHVAHVASLGWKDWNVVRYARDGDFILFTNNASGFRHLYTAQLPHAGLIILVPAVDGDLQWRLFKAALDELAMVGEPVNRVLEVDLDGDDATLARYDLPQQRISSVLPRGPAAFGCQDRRLPAHDDSKRRC